MTLYVVWGILLGPLMLQVAGWVCGQETHRGLVWASVAGVSILVAVTVPDPGVVLWGLSVLAAGVAGWVGCRVWHLSRWDAAARWADEQREDWLSTIREARR